MKKTRIAVLVLASLLSVPVLFAAPPAETRVALVIGNSAYPNVPLKNPANDARDVAAALKGLGFSVSLVTDGDMATMSRAIRDFGAAIKRPDAVALFYYSGHGVQYQGANYLVPSKSDIQAPDELSFSAINADQVYAKMESSGDKTNIVILDACRNNPFPGAERSMERGLAVVGNIQPPQSLIVYATAPGKTAQDGEGRNGIFTAALLKHISEPNVDIELMVRKVRDEVMAATGGAQVPWQNSSLSGGGFSFAVKEEPKPAAVAVAPVAAVPAAVASAPASAPKKTSAASKAAPAGKGILRIASTPSGMRVSIDGGEPLVTPIDLELEPGAHSFEPQATFSGKTYYLGEPKQWVTVSAGADLTIPLQPKPAEATLVFKLVPPGYKVLLNGQEIGETPLGPTKVNAGALEIGFERGGESDRLLRREVKPGETATISWGATPDTAVSFEKRTIALNGKLDSWGDLQPLYEAGSAGSRFMGSSDFGIKSVYICKDEKYLYWRFDFNAVNPLVKQPKGMGKAIIVQLTVNNSKGQNLNLSVQYRRDNNDIYTYTGLYDEKTRKWTRLEEKTIATRQDKDMFVARIPIDRILKYCPGPAIIVAQLANNDDKFAWMNEVDAEPRYVDFGK